MKPPPEFYTAQEIAHRLRVTEMTVYRWGQCGRLPMVRVGRCVRFPRAPTDAVIAGGAGELGRGVKEEVMHFGERM